jgi:hypothetical protein
VTDDDLATDPTVQELVTKLDIYRAWLNDSLAQTARLRRERDALREELRRYCAARV